MLTQGDEGGLKQIVSACTLIAMCLCLMISIFPLGWAEEWLPWAPTPDQVFFTFVENDGALNMTVTILFYDTRYNVSDWGEPQISGNIISVDTTMWRWTGITNPVFIYESFNYTLGDLAPGSYLFNFNVWGDLVKNTTFTVGEPVHLPSVSIRADGSIDPPTAPISTVDNVTYILTGSITTDLDGIMIEKDNVTLDGDGYTLRGSDSGYGINLTGRSCVTVKNMNITAFNYGVYLYSSSNNTVSGNNVTANNSYGVWLTYASNYNILIGNRITNSAYGVRIDDSSSYNDMTRNSITDNIDGIGIYFASRNNISGNDISANSNIGITIDQTTNNTLTGNNITSNTYHGVWLHFASFNTIGRNNIANNGDGVGLFSASDNNFYHNNFTDNGEQVYSYDSANTWDNDYPSGGNYWSDYIGEDLRMDPNQSQPNPDGIGDTPYVIDENNVDRYPLMRPWTPPDIEALNITSPKYAVGQDYPCPITAMFKNSGNKVEEFSIRIFVGNVSVQNQIMLLLSGDSIIFSFNWTETGEMEKGSYSLTALAIPLAEEVETTNNVFTGDSIIVTIAGDVNGDSFVNAKDAVMLGTAFGTTSGNESYYANADINDDNWINAKDAAILGTHYLEHW